MEQATYESVIPLRNMVTEEHMGAYMVWGLGLAKKMLPFCKDSPTC